MPSFPRLKASFVLLLVLETACQKRQVAVPPPPPPPTANTQPASPAPAPAPTTSQPTATKKPVRSATSPTPAATAPAPATPPASPTPAPKLGDILTPDEQRRYSAAIDQSLSHAQASLNAIGARQLNKDQQAQVEQIRNFMRQARATRGSDPAGARSLSERAEVLARDLAASFH